MSSDTGDLLEFGSIDVYYIVWYENDTMYYLRDMTPSFNYIIWTKNQRTAFFFYTEKEATKHARQIKKTRKGVSIAIGEVDILDEITDMIP